MVLLVVAARNGRDLLSVDLALGGFLAGEDQVSEVGRLLNTGFAAMGNGAAHSVGIPSGATPFRIASLNVSWKLVAW